VEDFTTSLVNFSQNDNSTKKIIALITKQATNPTLDSEYTITSVSAKDFLFGRLFVVVISVAGKDYSALVYHDHSSEQAQLLSWGVVGEVSNCLSSSGTTCKTCV
jgi:hypothetical protein